MKGAIIMMPSTARSRCSGQRTRNRLRTLTVDSTQTSTNGSEAPPRMAEICIGG